MARTTKRKLTKKAAKEEARQQVIQLMKEAGSVFSHSRAGAKRLVRKARRLVMKFRMRMPAQYKRCYCKHCYSYLKQGVNCRVRLAKQRVIYQCQDCNKFMRFPYAKGTKAKKQRSKK